MNSNNPKIFIINGVRMDLSEFLDMKEKEGDTGFGGWDEDWSYPEEDDYDDTASKRWDD